MQVIHGLSGHGVRVDDQAEAVRGDAAFDGYRRSDPEHSAGSPIIGLSEVQRRRSVRAGND